MRSSERKRLRGMGSALAFAWVTAWSFGAAAQAQGFRLERLYQSAPGAGWVVMDDLDLRGGLGGALAFSAGYAHNPLRLTSSDGSQHLSLVRHDVSVSFGAAVTFDRMRFYLDASSPMFVEGDAGTIDGYRFPSGQHVVDRQDCGDKRVCVDPGWNPDTLSDVRFGFDVRLFGDTTGPFRLGLGTQLFVPAGERADYVSDGQWRAMDRLLFAGNLGHFAYAGHVGVHFRRLDDSPAPGSPRGSEALFGFAAGPRLPVGDSGKTVFVLGPEVYGATAFRAFFGDKTTALEALLSGRLEGTGQRGSQLRLKLGAGAGLHSEFGAPEWRTVFAVEMFDRNR